MIASAKAFWVVAVCALPIAAAAQGADSADTDMTTSGMEAGILLELNAAVPTDEGNCRLTMVTTNRLDQGLTRAAWQVAIFDSSGVVQALPILDFGALAQGKTKVALFELPQRACDGIGQIIVNDVAECTGEDDGDLRGPCLSALSTRTRTPIDFGL